MQTASGGGLVYDDGKNIERTNYNNWSKLSFTDKMKRRFNIAKHQFNESSSPIINSVGAIFGEYDPKNPDLNTGEAPSPGWGKQGVTGLHKMMAKLPEAKQTLLAPLAGRSRAATIIKDKNIVEAQKHRDEVYRRWASLYKQQYDPTPTTFRTKPARVKRQETDISKSNGRTLAGGKGNAGGSYNNKSHTINVTTSKTVSAKNLEDIGFHEGIHSYGLGESPSYVWKSKYLNFPEGTNPYFLDPREIATHGIQQGQNLGIKVGQTYPGREAMIKMIENRPEGQGFGGVPMILYNNAKTNTDYRRLWSLLNGTFKQGGKINMIEFLKKGSGIHIKKENRGKFTSYCGGKVTDECIQKGKNSSNPAIRKRATFADNARHFKHKEGGIIKADEGTKFLSKQWFKNAGNDISDFFSSDTGKGLLDLGKKAFSGYTDYRTTSNLLDSQVEQAKADLEQTYNDTIQEALQNRILRQQMLKDRWQQAYQNGETLDNYSDIVASNIGWNEYSSSLQNAERQKRQQETLMDQQAKQAKSSTLGNLFGNVVQSGLGVLGNVLGNKNSTTTQNLLNNSTIGKSTNPYMYTGLGANYNASTFFK